MNGALPRKSPEVLTKAFGYTHFITHARAHTRTHTHARARAHTHTHTHARTHTLSLSLSLSLVGCWRLYRQSALNPDSDFRSKHILLSSALRETRGIVLEKRKQLHLNGQKLQENLVNDFSFANWKGRNLSLIHI